MASVINTNLASLYAQRNLSGAQDALSTSVERLSSGLRINRAKDDAAGLGISEQIKRQITALNQGVRNANDAISMVQATEGSLSEVSDILMRMKELAVQGRDDALSVTQRKAISDELVQLKNEINSIADRTSFNGLSLLKNSVQQEVDETNSTLKATSYAGAVAGAASISISGLVLRNANVGDYSVNISTTAIEIEASANTGTSTRQSITIGSLTAAETKLFDFDELGIQFQIKNDSGSALAGTTLSASLAAAITSLQIDNDWNTATFQLGSSTRDTFSTSGFKDIRITGYNNNSSVATSTGIKEDDVFDDIYTTLDTIDGNSVGVLTSTNFATLANRIETAIITVGDFRSYLGAQQNRIEFAIANTQAQSENLSAANSRIRDTDFAAETANLTRTQIMQQAATAMLAQANQMPNVILALLK